MMNNILQSPTKFKGVKWC